MKKKHLFLCLLALLGSTTLQAYDAYIGGIYYNFDAGTNSARVTYKVYNSTSNNSAYSGSVVIPEKVVYNDVEYSVTMIESYAFSKCTNLSTVKIPNTVTTIGVSAFSNCSSMTSASIGDGVTQIASCAFLNCSALKAVSIGSSVSTYGTEVFKGCNQLTAVTAKRVTPASIQSDVFYNQANATLYVPYSSINAYKAAANWKSFKSIEELDSSPIITFADDKVKSICVSYYDINGDCELSQHEVMAVTSLPYFYNNTEITSFNELQYFVGLTSINAYFYGCSNLTSVTIPGTITSIGYNTFNGCTSLTSIVIPEGVTSIGESAFSGCSSLTSIAIPNSLTSIARYAFDGCTNLEKVIVSDIAAWCGVSFYDGSTNPLSLAHHLFIDENTEITDLVIPDGVASLGSYTFYGCTGLTSVTIPNGVASTGNSTFYGCTGLTSVTLPESVTTIGSSTFNGCI